MRQTTKNLLTLTLILVLSLVDLSAQNMVKVSGTMTDALDSSPIIGGTIVAGPTSGVTTSVEGTYTITVAQGTTLSYQYLGYQTVEWTVPDGVTEITHDWHSKRRSS